MMFMTKNNINSIVASVAFIILYEVVNGRNPDILYQVLKNKSYDHQIRPNVSGAPVVIKLFILITDIHSVSESSMDFGITMFLVQNWNDERLSFNGTEAIDLRSGSELMKKIWMPDSYFVNEKDGKVHDITMENKQIRVEPDGHVTFDIRVSMTLTCYMRLQRFPMDKQMCGMDIESFGYTVRDVVLEWHERSVILEDITMPDFSISQSYTTMLLHEYPMGKYSRLTCTFYMERELIFYLMEHYVPSALLVILSWVSFWIGVDVTPARASLGITTVLTLTTLSSGARANLPKVSYIKAIDVWMFTCSFFTFAALLEFAVTSFLHKRGQDMPIEPKLKDHKNNQSNIIELKEYLKSPEKTQRDADSPKRNTESRIYVSVDNGNDDEKDQTDYLKLAHQVDQTSRFLFPAAFVLFNTIYWPYYIYM
ncbi:glycine receptor subunit alpha-1-like [Glandiceps talaboti]